MAIGILQINYAQGKGEPCYFGSCDEVCFFGEDCKESPNQKKPKTPIPKKLSINGIGQIQFGMSKQQVVNIYKHRISFDNSIGSIALDTDDGPFGLYIYFDDANLVTKLTLHTVPLAPTEFSGGAGQRLVQNRTESPGICDNIYSKLQEKLFNKYGKPTNELTLNNYNEPLQNFTRKYNYNFPDGSNIELSESYSQYGRSGAFFGCNTTITLFLSSSKEESKDTYQFK